MNESRALFGGVRQAAGYAHARPPLHPLIVERLNRRVRRRFDRALDLGCGSGLSTAPLPNVARDVVGMEPERAMLRVAGGIAAEAELVGGRTEALPFASDTFDLLAAAGSLNQVDLSAFGREATRVLQPGGLVWIYDFGPGREFRDSDRLSSWWAEFERRFPFPPWRELTPKTIASEAAGIQLDQEEAFTIPLELEWEFYVDYAMTEINVTAAIGRGDVVFDEARAWCVQSLERAFEGGSREVLFRGYWAILSLD
ncbi:MAG: methyltransferase domain-containing protein [Planctomycetota bacterium]|nr:methyltransferase domain-containing protein [Planctomycetota bacterium]